MKNPCSVFGMARALSAILLCLTNPGIGFVFADEPLPAKSYATPVVIPFEGVITPLREQYLYRKLALAKRSGADLVILEIESPGGTVDSSLAIAKRMRDLEWADTVAWIPRQALSGAAIVSLGCDRIVLAPDAVIGDAGPIMEGEFGMYEKVPEKVRSHLAREVRDLAAAHQRPACLAEAMVDPDLVVYSTVHRQTGEQRYMSAAELRSAGGEAVWERGPSVLESSAGRYLEVNGLRAVALGLADATASDRAKLFAALDLQQPPVILKPGGIDVAAAILNQPFVTGLLFVVGLIALYVEFSSPGISLGGLISFLCFALFFWSRFLGGTAETLEVILFLVGVAFVAIEVFVLPGFGIAGITGLLLMLVSVVAASQNFIIPRTPWQLDHLVSSLLVVACSGLCALISTIILSRHFGTLPMFGAMVLPPPRDDASDQEDQGLVAGGKPVPMPSASALSVGDWGITASPLRPAGIARFGDLRVDVMTSGEYVDRGRQVRIVEIRPGQVVVCDVESEANT